MPKPKMDWTHASGISAKDYKTGKYRGFQFTTDSNGEMRVRELKFVGVKKKIKE